MAHYLGHSCFAMQFDNGIRILCDYGKSNSYGYPSPIYDICHLYPDVVTYSHTHTDHYGREIPYDVPHVLLKTDSLEIEGIKINSALTCESLITVKGNGSYFFRYKDLTICHLGDAGATMLNLADEDVKNEVLKNFPKNIDLLFLTIESQDNLVAAAENFIDLIKPKRVIPMHYWTPQTRATFFAYLQTKSQSADKNYDIESRSEAKFFFSAADSVTPIKVIGLAPAPFVPHDTPDIFYENHELDDSEGNGNGKAESGETVNLGVTLKNISLDASVVTATLINDDPDVQILNGTCNFGGLINGEQKSNASNPFTFSVSLSSEAHYNTFGLNITADGIFECTEYFQIAIGNAIVLLVDDDCCENYEQYYTQHTFADVWDVSEKGCPGIVNLQDYQSVVWFTGDDRVTTLTNEEQDVIAEFLDAGGNLLLTGQNIGYDLAANGSESDLSFYTNYLHSEFVSDSSTATMMLGTSGHPITNGLFINLTGPAESANNQTSPDVISPIAPATTILNYIPGFTGAAVCYENAGTGARMVYLAFGFEGIAGPQTTSAKDLLQKIFDWFQMSTSVEQKSGEKNIPKKFNLQQNYPNPFNATTYIKYSIPEKTFVTIKLYNMLGKELAVLVSENKNPGNHKLCFNGSYLASGIYFYKLDVGSFVEMKKFLLLK